jgi:hypothetical protein
VPACPSGENRLQRLLSEVDKTEMKIGARREAE